MRKDVALQRIIHLAGIVENQSDLLTEQQICGEIKMKAEQLQTE